MEQATRSSTLAEKNRQVAELQEKLKSAKMAVLTEYRGLSVAQIVRLRRELRQVSGEYKVIKNTLGARALKDTTYGALEELLKGPTGWVFAYEDPVVLSKVLMKFFDEHPKLTIKAGLLEGALLNQEQLKGLAKMPSRPELLAKLLALMQAPATQLLRLIQEPGAQMVRLLEGLRKNKEQA